jgi:hypothetical protein
MAFVEASNFLKKLIRFEKLNWTYWNEVKKFLKGCWNIISLLNRFSSVLI